MKKNGVMGSILSYAKPCKGKLLLSIACALISVAGSIAPFVAAYHVMVLFFDNSATSGAIIYWSLVCALGFLIKVVFHAISTTLSHVSAYTILEIMRKKIADKLLKAPLGITQGLSAGKVKSIVVDQVETIEIPLAHVIPEGAAALVLPLAVFGYLCVIDFRLALASLITVPLSMIPYGIMLGGYNKTYSKYMESNEHMNNVVVEYVEGIEVVKAFNQSTTSYEKYRRAVESFKKTTLDWYKSTWKYTTLGSVILPSTLLGVLPIGTLMYLSGSATLPDITMAMLLSMGLVSSLGRFILFFNQIKSIQYSVSSINKTFDIGELPQVSRERPIKKHDIRLEHVTFSYTGKEDVLHDVSLTIPENSFSAVVGPSGGGKSTLARLIARFWDTTKGSITIGGVNIKDIPLTQLADEVSFVTQDNFLFNCSIMENIRLGNPKAADAQVLEAARKAQCDEFIGKLEKGYQSMAGEAGDKLSGGERQRITIARAILKNAPIIILDEATSFTDPENEAKIQEAIAELTKGKTLLVIAHRLSTIKNADNILLINQGKVEQSGTHEAMLQKSPLYSEMWQAHIGAKKWSVRAGSKEVLA
ncbi:MAG TPA: ABC transporter ATP-binding protein [Clostridiales bacterium]|nr:ABC transporter ATP-binding protein [Clostridiales bacterium]